MPKEVQAQLDQLRPSGDRVIHLFQQRLMPLPGNNYAKHRGDSMGEGERRRSEDRLEF
jgi:hypothetical protein